MRKGQFLFLGTGASLGVPVVGCSCEVCKSQNKKNKRLRPSGLLKIDKKQILIDCGPDFRQQALLYDLSSLEGLVLTHAHYDHIEGIDELRVYAMQENKPLPCLLSSETAADLRRRFAYIFQPEKPDYMVTTNLELQEVSTSRGEVIFLGERVRFFSYKQAGCSVLGLRMGDFAYVSDIKEYDKTIFEDLQGTRTLVVSALRETPSYMHLTIEEAISFSRQVGAEQTYFTHIAHDLDHEKAESSLPENIYLAYDGLIVDFGF